jgi:hypothetical protein
MSALLHLRLAASAATSTYALPPPSAHRRYFNVRLATSTAHHSAFNLRLAATAATSTCALPPPPRLQRAPCCQRSPFNLRLACCCFAI